MGAEAEATLKRLASRLAAKWWQPYSRTWGCDKSRVAITLARATHRCIRVLWLQVSQISIQLPHWEYGAVLNLYR